MAPTPSAPKQPQPQFPYLMDLSDDLILTILSFVADIPLEEQDYETTIGISDFYSTTTHVLPYVSKHFYNLLKGGGQNLIYKNGLIRLCHNDPKLWKTALLQLIPAPVPEPGNSKTKKKDEGSSNDDTNGGTESSDSSVVATAYNTTTSNNKQEQRKTTEELLEQLVQTTSPPLMTVPMSCYTNFFMLYKTILDTQLRFCGPIFYMPDTIMLYRPIGLHFFEQRYRLLIQSVMEPYPNEAKRGRPLREVLKKMSQPGNSSSRNKLKNDYPKFIYAHASPLQIGSPAVIVEVHQCLIHPNGTADVHLLPVQFVWLEQIWERPNSGALYYAQGRKMNSESSSQMEGRPPFMTFQ